MYTFKKDKFQKNRGGASRCLDVCCESCGSHIAYYQKDGPGMLKRMYQDRFIDITPADDNLDCPSCRKTVGIKITYEKENRTAYRLFAGAITKKIVSQRSLTN